MNEMVTATGKRAVADLLGDDGDAHDLLLHSQGAEGHRPPKKQRISTPSSEPSWPGYHGCGSIKGNREKFPKKKEKKRKRRDFLAYQNTFYL